MGFVPVLVATLVGGTLGIVAGYAGGLVNTAIMRTMDVFYAFPLGSARGRHLGRARRRRGQRPYLAHADISSPRSPAYRRA